MDETFRKIWANHSGFQENNGQEIDKCKIDYVTRKQNEWITKIELLRGDLQKLDIQIDNPEIMSHILSNLPEEYQTIVEIL